MVAKRIALPSKQVQLKVVGIHDSLVVPRIQRLTLNADKPATDVDELGNRLHAGTISDVPAITVTFQSEDVGTKLFSILTGTDNTAYPVSGVSISALTDIDAIVLVKNQVTEQYVKTGHAQRCTIRDIAMSYSVDGDSTEEYTYIGKSKRWFTKDLVVQRFTSGVSTFTLSATPVTLRSGNKCLSVIMDGNYLTEVAAGPTTGQYSVSGTTLTTGDARVSTVMVVFQYGDAGAWTDINETSMPAAIKGMDVPVLLGVNNIERVQSVTINTAFNPTAVKEMGNRDPVGYQSQNPAVTGTITVLDTDTELISLFTTGVYSVSGGGTEFQVSDLTATGIALTIKLLDPADTSVPYTVLKTLWIPAITITSDGFTSNVNANAQQTFDYRATTGELRVYQGAKTV